MLQLFVERREGGVEHLRSVRFVGNSVQVAVRMSGVRTSE
jgi:hypothetical protein